MTRRDDLIAALVISAVAVGGIAVLLPPDIFSFAYWQEGGASTSRSEVFRNLGLAGIALGALIVGSMRAMSAHRQARAANEQARIAEQGHITERFSRAVEQLGHDSVTVRIGGLYALKRIAEDSLKRDHLTIMGVITNFIRHPPYADAQREAAEQGKALRAFRENSAEVNADANQNGGADQAGAAAPPPKPELIDCPDIVAAIEIIQGRSKKQKAVEDKQEYRLSLSGASLSYLRLPEVDLRKFTLSAASLTGAFLTGADLTDANLTEADLRGASLLGASLRAADLTGAHLTGADLMFAKLTGAKLIGANFTGARLLGADLTDADLTAAKLGGANLSIANLTGANLTDADLTAAKLGGAEGLTQDQLDTACIRKGGRPPTLPDYVKQPDPWKTYSEPTAE